ncbi:hypothetical protein RSOL_335370 [Rhizoctonia solani AG-3 Rhs1AP]|uniref:Uncharacterized protein n=1 Tax=Rhizoctonia solani AG-3 Rhs1AP TaxID=1086054 RepID=X8JBJ4_9AGAM|nr:hypothetical protein RSOL_335370 [Rhizoctonia solani AG-3 Rhs1AP]
MSDNSRSLPRAPNPESSTPHLSTSTLRLRLIEATVAAVGKTPYPWQLDVAEALCNRRDVMCIAGPAKANSALSCRILWTHERSYGLLVR